MARDSRPVWWTKRFVRAIEFCTLEKVHDVTDLMRGRKSQMTVAQTDGDLSHIVCDLFSRSQCRYQEAFQLRLKFNDAGGRCERDTVLGTRSPLQALLHGYDAGSDTSWLYPWILVNLVTLRRIFQDPKLRSSKTGKLWGETRGYDGGWIMWIDLRAMARAFPPERQLILDASYLRSEPLPKHARHKLIKGVVPKPKPVSYDMGPDDDIPF
jgi:hypothetical protein